jgi:hypothetical protein
MFMMSRRVPQGHTAALVLMAILLMITVGTARAGPAAYGICQTGCNALVVSCYAAGGFTFGTVTGGAGIPAAIAACNTSLGLCMVGCVAAGFAPTP